MSELTLELFLSISALIVSVTFFLAGLILWYLRSIDKTVDRIGVVFGIAFKDEVVDYYKSSMKEKKTSNPHSSPHNPSSQPTEKDILLERLRDGSISPGEAQRLHLILEREAAEARARGAVGALLAILGLLALLALIAGALSD